MSVSHAHYLLGMTAAAVGLLMVLILWVRLHPALAILVAAIGLGAVSGMPLNQIAGSLATGVGNLLGHVALVLGLGAVLGNLLASSGGATAVGESLVDRFGKRGLPFAMLAMGVLVGFPVFFEVGLVLLMPVIVSVAKRTGKSAMLTGMPTLAGLSIVHGLIPPHPAAMLAVTQYHADVGWTILLGLTAGLPAAVVAGPGWVWVYRRIHGQGEERLQSRTLGNAVAAGAGVPVDLRAPAGKRSQLIVSSLVLLAFPVVLIFLGSWANLIAGAGSAVAGLNPVFHLVGDPSVALLCALMVALPLLGGICGWTAADKLKLTGESFGPIAGVLLILAAAGGLSRILGDCGASQAVVELAQSVHLSPLLLAWLLAASLRLAVGSATVAMAVTTGILAPLAIGMSGGAGHMPELLVLATGSGSLFCSHLNDAGFWMVKEFFGMDVSETLATWSVMETIISVVGLLGTLGLAAVLR